MFARMKLVGGVLFVMLILIGVYVFAPKSGVYSGDTATTVGPVAETVPQPTYTPEMAAILAKSHGFQVLVSYTSRGFEPRDTTIRAGQAVRFINNSMDPLWVAASGEGGGSVYPGEGDMCGQSSFDTCVQLKPGEFWEFTFEEAGSWSYKNNMHTSDTGIVRVRE